MFEQSSDERVTEVLRRLLSIMDVIAPVHFDALTGRLMKAIGAEAMAEAERRSFILHEPPPARAGRCSVIPFPIRPDGARPDRAKEGNGERSRHRTAERTGSDGDE